MAPVILKRKIVVPAAVAAPPTAQSQKEVQERYYCNLVLNNAKYPMIIAHIVEGTTLTDIASHWALNGWITVNERTFVEALRTFRRLRSADIEKYQREGLASIVMPNQPRMSEEAALEQLIRLQHVRLGQEVQLEKNVGKLFNTTAREIESTRRLVETLAKVRGKIKEGGGGGVEPTSQDVFEDLSKIKKDEGTRNRLHALTSEIAKRKKETA